MIGHKSVGEQTGFGFSSKGVCGIQRRPCDCIVIVSGE